MTEEHQSAVRPFGPWDYTVMVLVLLASVAIGLYHAFKHRRHANTSEILMAGRSMGTLPVALSILATYFSATSLLGVPAEIYLYGVQQIWFLLSYTVVIPLTIYCFLPVFYDAKLTSTYEYLELRFNSLVRKFASAIFILQTTLSLVVVLYAPALALSHVTRLSIWTSVSVIGTICILYTTLGGMRAVLWTDAFQICIILISVATVMIKGSLDIGGLGEIWHQSKLGGRLHLEFSTDPTLRQSFWSVSTGGVFIWLSYFGVSQSLVQRYLTTKSLKVAKKALWGTFVGLIVMHILYCFGGLVIYARYFSCDPLKNGDISAPDQLLSLFVMDTLSSVPGLPGLFVAGVFCASLSTLSSGLNGLAAVTLEDFVRPVVDKLSEQRAALLSKLMPLAYGIMAVALVAVADQMGNIVQATLSINGIVGGPLLGLFLLGMMVPWANSMGACFGLFGGLALSTWIGVGAQLSKVRSTTLPLSTESCPINSTIQIVNATLSSISQFTTPPPISNNNADDVFPLFKVSYLWYSSISCLTVLMIGTFISLLTQKGKYICKPELLFPPIRKLVKYVGKRSVTKKTTQFQMDGTLDLPENENLLMNVISQDKKLTFEET